MNLFEVMSRGGWVMWPILLCLFMALFVFMERWFALRRGRFDTSQFLLKLKSLYRHGDIPAVLSYCSQKDVPMAGIVRRGVLKRDLGTARIREAVESAAREEMFRLEKNLSLLAGISTIAPTLGFLGSVLGLITAFQISEHTGVFVPTLEHAAGIWQALLTTAFGLIVGIVASAGYNVLVARVKKLVHELEVASNEFLDILDEPMGPGNGSNGDEVKIATRQQVLEPEPFQRKE
jgi:biopolymer transport protein ExbB